MMQFTRSAPPVVLPQTLPPLLPDGLGFLADDLDEPAPKPASLPRSWPWPGLLPSNSNANSKANYSLGGSGGGSGGGSRSLTSASCMEQLLVHCATAIERNDATLAQQLLWVLHNIAPADGDSTQRLTAAFLRALIARASRTGSCKMLSSALASADADLALHLHRFSAVDLATFVDLTPWHRFGYAAANAAIVEAAEGLPVLHVVDLGTNHCMQIPTLIDLLAGRPEGPPLLRLTVPILTAAAAAASPPVLDMPYDELGARLVNFARSRNVAMDFRVVPSDPHDAFEALLEQLRLQRIIAEEGEALIVNCQMLLHYLPDETAAVTPASTPHAMSMRSMFLKALRGLEPSLVTVVDEDADFTARDVVGRLRAAFNYMWMPYDAVEAFLAKGSERRRWYEGGVCWKIENVVAGEGAGRVERQEPRGRWAARMRAAGFRSVGYSEEAAGEVRGMLEEHAAGWGMKREEEDLVLTWKGHNVVFATAWVPS